MIRLLLCCVVLVCPVTAYGDSPQVVTPTGKVRVCTSFKDGSILAGTAGGLVRIDAKGSPRKVFTRMNGLPGTDVHAVMTQNQDVWVGTDRGMARFEKGADGLTLIKQWKTAAVRDIRIHQGKVYLATWGQGIARIDIGTNTLTTIPYKTAAKATAKRVTALGEHQGQLVAGTAGAGILRLENDRLNRAYPTLKNSWVWTLKSQASHLWVGTFSGLVALGPKARETYAKVDVRQLSRHGQSLVATTANGRLLELKKGMITPFQDPGPKGVHATTWTKHHGMTCVGSKHGLWARKGEGAWQQLIRPTLPDGDIAALAHDGKRLWAGLFDHGLWVLEEGLWREVGRDTIDRKVNAIDIEPGGTVWVGTARGVHAIGSKGIRTLTTRDGLPSGDIHALKVLQSGAVLVGTGRGAALIRKGQIEIFGRKEGLNVAAVWSVAEGPKNELLLGTSRGLIIRNRGGTWTHLSVATGHLRCDWITALTRVGSDIWVGTYNRGLTRLQLKGRKIHTQHFGRRWVNLAGLTAHRGKLLVATMTGLVARPLNRPWKRKRMRLAAPGLDVTATVSTSQGLWVASRKGLAFHPEPEPKPRADAVPTMDMKGCWASDRVLTWDSGGVIFTALCIA